MMALPPLMLAEIPAAGWHGHPLFSLDNIYRAYRQCRRRKRNTINALRFERELEGNLVELHQALQSATYTPRPALAFLVSKPKRREIFAADFRDRVVHHLLVAHLEPHWERRFIHDSYACRKGKGTYQAVDRLRTFTRQVTANGSRRAWYLQLDVRGFFITLDRRILYRQLTAREPAPAVHWLLQVILCNDLTANCRFRDARQSDFERLPPHKTLFKAAPGCGLPIGNLTSQFFANVYLDPLDQFIKHELKARHYLRYCDDLVLLSTDAGQLADWEQRIETFLGQQLGLQLNERRRLRPVAAGIDWLGYIVRPEYSLVRRRVVMALRERLDRAERELQRLGMQTDLDGRAVYPWPWPLLEQLRQWLNAYLAHFAKASSRRLLQALRERYPWLEEYLHWQGNKVDYRCPIPRHALRFVQQQAWFTQRLADHILLVQQGGFWQMTLPVLPASEASQTDLTTLKRWPDRFPQRRLSTLSPLLWHSGLAVAWIAETGGRLDAIAERALSYRWA